MLKKISEIATICNSTPDKIRAIIKKEDIIPAGDNPMRLDIYQFNYVFMILYHENKIGFLTFESSMNFPETLYSRAEMIKKGFLTPSNGNNL